MSRWTSSTLLGSFHYRDYRILWVVVALVNSASWAFTLALGWKINDLTQSPFWVGASMFATLAPNLIGAPLAGSLADRLNRKTLMLLSVVLTGTIVGIMAALSASPKPLLGLTLGLAFLYGLGSSVMTVSLNALLPGVVPKEKLFNAVSLQAVAQRGTEFVGPALASPLLAAFGSWAVFLFCSVLYVVAAVMARFIYPSVLVVSDAKHHFLEHIAEGMRYVWRAKLVAIVIALVGFHCMLTMSYMGVLPHFIQVDLKSDSQFYGMTMSVIGLGCIVGTLTLASITSWPIRGVVYVVTGVFSGLSLVGMGLTNNHTIVLLAAFAVGLSQAVFMALSLAYVQDLVLESYRGRVTSVYIILAAGLMSIANWGYGALAGAIEPRVLWLATGLAFAVLVLITCMWSSNLRNALAGRFNLPAHLDPLPVIEAT